MLALLSSHLTASTTNVVLCQETKDFDGILKEVSQSQEHVVVIFTAGEVSPTGRTWCSDCDRAKKNIEEMVIGNVPRGEKVIKCVINQNEYTA
jgi:TATA-box binding protein (TBP) (component of TFIID and TFIIIB)